MAQRPVPEVRQNPGTDADGSNRPNPVFVIPSAGNSTFAGRVIVYAAGGQLEWSVRQPPMLYCFRTTWDGLLFKPQAQIAWMPKLAFASPLGKNRLCATSLGLTPMCAAAWRVHLRQRGWFLIFQSCEAACSNGARFLHRSPVAYFARVHQLPCIVVTQQAMRRILCAAPSGVCNHRSRIPGSWYI